MNDDLRELLGSLNRASVEFVVIGAHALAYHGRQRATEDIDLWLRRTAENAERLRVVLSEFGMDIGHEGAQRFFERDRQMIRLGAPPNMVDLLNFAGNTPFENVWQRREPGEIEGVPAFFPSREDLIEMKRTAGRFQDLADLERLGERP